MVHLLESGFDAVKVDVSQAKLSAIAKESGVPPLLSACHTAKVEGYVIEGHVSAQVISKLVQERPNIRGLSVPGMPPGSPGMGGTPTGPIDVYAFGDSGSVSLYAVQ